MFFHVNANSQTLDIKLSSLNKLLCSVPFSDLSIPLDEIDNIVAQPPEATAAFKGVKVGVNVPGLLTAGTYYHHKKKNFYFIKTSNQSIAIHLKKGAVAYDLLVLAVPDDETPDACKVRLDREINDAKTTASVEQMTQ
jgi:hypothetical protein